MRPPPRRPVCMPYTIQYWYWQYRVKAKRVNSNHRCSLRQQIIWSYNFFPNHRCSLRQQIAHLPPVRPSWREERVFPREAGHNRMMDSHKLALKWKNPTWGIRIHVFPWRRHRNTNTRIPPGSPCIRHKHVHIQSKYMRKASFIGIKYAYVSLRSVVFPTPASAPAWLAGRVNLSKRGHPMHARRRSSSERETGCSRPWPLPQARRRPPHPGFGPVHFPRVPEEWGGRTRRLYIYRYR